MNEKYPVGIKVIKAQIVNKTIETIFKGLANFFPFFENIDEAIIPAIDSSMPLKPTIYSHIKNITPKTAPKIHILFINFINTSFKIFISFSMFC